MNISFLVSDSEQVGARSHGCRSLLLLKVFTSSSVQVQLDCRHRFLQLICWSISRLTRDPWVRLHVNVINCVSITITSTISQL